MDAVQRRLRDLDLPEGLRRPGVRTVEEAWAYLDSLGDDAARALYLQEVLQFCVTTDPAASIELAASSPEEKWRDVGTRFVLLKWAATDPSAALHWAAQHPRAANDPTRFYAAYEGFASAQPMEALHLLREPTVGADLDQLTRITVFQCLQANELAGAKAWTEALPEGNLRDLLVQQIAREWASRSPEEAATWLASVASEAAFTSGMGALLQRTAESRPELAANLTQKFSEPEIRADRLADLVYVWAKRDLGGAAAWVRAQPASPHLDSAIARLAEATAPFDPGEARTWISRIQNPQVRSEWQQRLRL